MEAGRKTDYKEGDLGGRMRKFILGGVAFLALFALGAVIVQIQQGNIKSRYDGQVVYEKNCQSCHGDKGQGGLADEEGNLGFPALNNGDCWALMLKL